MNIHISQDVGTAIYLQIINQIKYQVAAGSLNTGDELPTIRSLAEQLIINPNTVARAYRELQTEGIIDKRGTAGSFISASGSPLAKEKQLSILEQKIDALLSDASNMDVSVEKIKQLIDERNKILKQNLK